RRFAQAGTPAGARGRSQALRRSGDRVPLRARRLGVLLELAPKTALVEREPVHAGPARPHGPRRHIGLSLLPANRPGSDWPGSNRVAGLLLPDRDGVPLRPAGLPSV